MGDDIDQAQEQEERIRQANKKKENKKMPVKMPAEYCPYCGKMITDNDDLISVGDKDHRIFACVECEGTGQSKECEELNKKESE